MASIKSFQDIEAWKKARELTKRIYQVTSMSGFLRDLCLRDQIRRASISIMSNIAEGFERRGDAEFGHFLSIAKGSSGEVMTQLIIAHDVGLLPDKDFHALYILSEEVSRIIGGFIKYIKQNKT